MTIDDDDRDLERLTDGALGRRLEAMIASRGTAPITDGERDLLRAVRGRLATREVPEREPGDAEQRQSVLDALPFAVVILDPAGRITAVNRAWRRFAQENGASPGLRDGIGIDYLGVCRLAEGSDSDTARAVAEGLEAVLRRDRASHAWEYPCHSPRQRRWFTLVAAPLTGPSEGAVVVHLDVTERKLAEERARRAQELAAHAARVNAVGVLAASLVHELAQPLSAASFFSGTGSTLLERRELDPERVAQVLTGLSRQIGRAAEILDRLREFLRQREIRAVEVGIDQVIEQALDLVRWYAADKETRLHLRTPAPGVRVTVDPVQIEQVLVNLITNGIQAIEGAAMTEREVSISVDVQPDTVAISVHDTGPGVPARVLEQAFDILKGDRDLDRGMGLATSRQIVESHGGTLWADLDRTRGAAFHFTLPRH